MSFLATFASPLPPRRSADFLGRHFASAYLGQTMLRSGLFEGFHFYVPSHAARETLRVAFAELPELSGVPWDVFLDLALPDNVRKFDYPYFHVPDIFPHMANLAHMREATGSSFRIVGHIHSISYAWVDEQIIEMLLAPLRSGDLVLCSSRAGREALRRLIVRGLDRLGQPIPPLGLAVVPFAVDTDRFCPGDSTEARARLGLGPRRVILSLARLAVADKQDYCALIEAFRLAAGQLQDWDLVLAGGATDMGYVAFLEDVIRQQDLAGRVVVRPNIEDASKPDLYRAAEMFVAPSDNFQETFGVSVVEAMASGLPVVASDWNGFRDTVVPEETGLLVDTYMPPLQELLAHRQLHDSSLMHFLSAQAVAVDVLRLAGSLVALGQDDAWRAEMGNRAREHAERRFGFEPVSAAIARVFGSEGEPPNREPDDTWMGSLTPWRLFSHYATRALGPGERLVVSEYGIASESRSVPLFFPAELHHCLLVDRLRAITRACAQPVGFEALVEAIATDPADTERAVYTIYWLLKQGLLQLA